MAFDSSGKERWLRGWERGREEWSMDGWGEGDWLTWRWWEEEREGGSEGWSKYVKREEGWDEGEVEGGRDKGMERV